LLIKLGRLKVSDSFSGLKGGQHSCRFSWPPDGIRLTANSKVDIHYGGRKRGTKAEAAWLAIFFHFRHLIAGTMATLGSVLSDPGTPLPLGSSGASFGAPWLIKNCLK